MKPAEPSISVPRQQDGLLPLSAVSSGDGGGSGSAPLTIEPLQGWHLPLLEDPAFLPLQPLLQRSVLLALPDRLITTITSRPPLACEVLVALRRDGPGRPRLLGLIASRRLNRTGTCWQVEHLRLALAAGDAPLDPGRVTISTLLLKEALQRARGATSWIATASTLDDARLSLLREQGFQPQRTDRIWRWSACEQSAAAFSGENLPGDLQLSPLNRRTAARLWHLEQACCPAPLRQLLDRRIEDLLDQSQGRGWMIVDPGRSEAVAGVRWLADHPCGGQQVEFSLHPGWTHLLGPATSHLLGRMAGPNSTLWLQGEVGDDARQGWLEQIGAEARGEQVLMARSVWRRQEGQPARRRAVRRLEAMLEQLQPRRRPIPAPLGRLARPISGT